MAKKLYYKIGEACKILDIQPYVLRYWEKEFPQLSPDKSKSGQRVYNEEELGIIRRIKELLYEEGYTIAGAKKKLEVELSDDAPLPAAAEAPAKPTDPNVEVDTDTVEALQRLVSGVEQAREQARDILRLLDSTSAVAG